MQVANIVVDSSAYVRQGTLVNSATSTSTSVSGTHALMGAPASIWQVAMSARVPLDMEDRTARYSLYQVSYMREYYVGSILKLERQLLL